MPAFLVAIGKWFATSALGQWIMTYVINKVIEGFKEWLQKYKESQEAKKEEKKKDDALDAALKRIKAAQTPEEKENALAEYNRLRDVLGRR